MTGAYGVLVSTLATGAQYTVSLVGTDGKVVASAQASAPPGVSCANAAGAPVPLPLATSDSRVYFMDAAGTVRYLAPNGQTGQAFSVPAGTSSRRSMFAVTPDDLSAEVVVTDFTATGAHTRMYIEAIGTDVRVDVFQEDGPYTLWPVGFHGSNNLVVAKAPACAQGGGAFCCGPLELHVVDPASANRRFTIGNSSSCVIVGPPSRAGAVCEDPPNFTKATVLNWTAGTVQQFAVQGATQAFLSPGGSQVAFVKTDTSINPLNGPSTNLSGLQACGWLDDGHVLAGGDSQHQARIGNVSNGTVIPVPAQGDCGGRLPGGL